MPHVPIAQPRAQQIAGTYWTPPTEATIAEIHPLLMAIIIMMPNPRGWGLYSANVYDMGSGEPLGYFDIALDQATRRACGHYSAVGSSVVTRSPIWFQCAGDENDAIQLFYELVREAGHVE